MSVFWLVFPSSVVVIDDIMFFVKYVRWDIVAPLHIMRIGRPGTDLLVVAPTWARLLETILTGCPLATRG